MTLRTGANHHLGIFVSGVWHGFRKLTTGSLGAITWALADFMPWSTREALTWDDVEG